MSLSTLFIEALTSELEINEIVKSLLIVKSVLIVKSAGHHFVCPPPPHRFLVLSYPQVYVFISLQAYLRHHFV